MAALEGWRSPTGAESRATGSWRAITRGLAEAVRSLVLDPLGVLHEEPGHLLLDDLRDTFQATAVLSLIGRDCHRVSGIAGRVGKPAISLGRPLQRLMEMGRVEREVPFGAAVRGRRSRE